MKVTIILGFFALIACTAALNLHGASPNIPGYDRSVVGFATETAPMCNEENFYCLLADEKDKTLFHRCIDKGMKAVSHKCNEGLDFIFDKQMCGKMTSGTAVEFPCKCATLDEFK